MKIYSSIILFLILIVTNGNAQPKIDETPPFVSVNANTCISGNCNEGVGKLLRRPPYDDYTMQLQGHFKNGSLNGEGEVSYFDKQHNPLYKFSGKFVDGLLVSGFHYVYGRGASKTSVEEENGEFDNNFLLKGKVTFKGYGSLIDGSYFVQRDMKGKCISGNCKAGKGTFLEIVVDYYGCTFVKQMGEFQNGLFVRGNMVIDGYEYEPLKNGVYTISAYKLHPQTNKYIGKASFKPKNFKEQIVGNWQQADTVNKYPFDVSNIYFTKLINGKLAVNKNAPVWMKNIYVPYLNMQNSLVTIADKSAGMELIDTTKENLRLADNYCTMCHGVGSINSQVFHMGRKMPMKCPGCHGYGKMGDQVKINRNDISTNKQAFQKTAIK